MSTGAKTSHGQEGLQLPAAGGHHSLPLPCTRSAGGARDLLEGQREREPFCSKKLPWGGGGGLGGVPSSTLEGGLR